MRIGIDTRDLKTATTGQKTYLEELCKAFGRHKDDGFTFIYFTSSVPQYKGKNKFFKIAEQLSLHFWKQCILPLKAAWNRCDILLCTDYFVPYIHPGFKTAVVFHDAFFFEHKEHYHPLQIALFKHLALPSAKRCTYIIVPSEYSRQQIIKHYTQLPPEKLVVVYEGPKSLTHYAENDKGAQILPRLGIEPQSYLLHVGVMNKRKNIPALIYAFKKVRDKGHAFKLVLAGSLHTSRYIDDSEAILAAIAATGLERDIILTGYIADNELAALYRHAFMYVFPSINEGFGLPVLEAFAYMLPVVVADNTCLPEIGGDAVLTFNPFDVNDIAARIELLINEPETREQLQQKGALRRQLFSWEKAADSILSLFRKALPHK